MPATLLRLSTIFQSSLSSSCSRMAMGLSGSLSGAVFLPSTGLLEFHVVCRLSSTSPTFLQKVLVDATFMVTFLSSVSSSEVMKHGDMSPSSIPFSNRSSASISALLISSPSRFGCRDTSHFCVLSSLDSKACPDISPAPR
eukprot:764838-Hanusia_phi.AAC.5